MVRSQNKPTTNDDIAVVLIGELAKFVFGWIHAVIALVCWAVAFPMLSVPLGLCVWMTSIGGEGAGIAAAVVFVLGLATWRLAAPSSFHRCVSGRIWKRRRAWRVYRRPWPHLCALHGLTAMLNESVVVPRLHRVQVGYVSDLVTVRMLYGQTLADWQGCSDALAHGFGAMGVRVRGAKPGWISIEVYHHDTLATPLALPMPAEGAPVDLERVAVGMTEAGEPWNIRVLGRHVLIGGATGSGKGSVVWSILGGLAPAIASGVVQVWVIDPKGGMEFGRGQALFARFAHDAGESAANVLAEAAEVLVARAKRLRGFTRLHVPTPTEPLILVVIDEMATLTAYRGDRKTRTELDQLLGLVLSQGRAVGVSVIAAVQDPSKEVIALRQLFPTRIALRLVEATQATMVLGDGARDRGAACDLIPDTLPGVGYVCEEGGRELVRVRAYHVTDADIDELCASFAPPCPPSPDTEPAQPPDSEA
ncbi:MAG: FtsK/SpoIIIE domain-containing protein [Acidimicrobiales bacterium]